MTASPMAAVASDFASLADSASFLGDIASFQELNWAFNQGASWLVIVRCNESSNSCCRSFDSSDQKVSISRESNSGMDAGLVENIIKHSQMAFSSS